MADESKARTEDAKAEKAAKKAAPKKAKGKKRGNAKAKPAKRAAATMKVNKSAFVRKQPLSMGPSEVVEKAKKRGITLTAQYVSTIRSKERKGKGSKSAPKRGRVVATGAKKGKPPEKAQRVSDLMAQHPDWTKAKIAEAVPCTPGYVYSVMRGTGKGRTRSTKGVAPWSKSTDGDHAAFYRFAKRVGPEEAQRLLTELTFIESV
jgi:hypothetical protein